MTPAQQMPAWSGPALLSFGFRPFFLSAAVWAALSVTLWVLMLSGRLELPTAFDPVSWHAHEALFGYLGAVVAGFLLTAVPNWTGRPPVVGWPLLGLFTLWLLGRGAVAVSSYLPPVIVAVIDLSCLVVLGGAMLRHIIVGRNWRTLIVLAMVGVFVTGNALFHWEAAWNGHAASGYGLRTGLAAGIIMIVVVGGRIVPAFTRNWLVERGSDQLPAAFGRLDKLALVLSMLALPSWVVAPDWPLTGYVLLAAGLAQTMRLSLWRGADTRAEPLVWILHVGYAFAPIGMLAMGTAILWPGPLINVAVQHVWMAGAIGVMTLAVMTRATLGHTGHALTAGAGTTWVYVLVIASVLVRLLGGVLPEWAWSLYTVSAILWCSAFAGFAVLYGSLLIRPPAES